MLLNIYSLLCLACVFHHRVQGSHQGSTCCIYILGSRKECCNEASRSSISISLARTFYVVNTTLRKARSSSPSLSSDVYPQHWYSSTKNKEKHCFYEPQSANRTGLVSHPPLSLDCPGVNKQGTQFCWGSHRAAAMEGMGPEKAKKGPRVHAQCCFPKLSSQVNHSSSCGEE